MPQILLDDEITKGKKLFKFKLKGSIQCGSYMGLRLFKYDRHNVEPVHILLPGSGGSGKSHLVIYDAIS